MSKAVKTPQKNKLHQKKKFSSSKKHVIVKTEPALHGESDNTCAQAINTKRFKGVKRKYQDNSHNSGPAQKRKKTSKKHHSEDNAMTESAGGAKNKIKPTVDVKKDIEKDKFSCKKTESKAAGSNRLSSDVADKNWLALQKTMVKEEKKKPQHSKPGQAKKSVHHKKGKQKQPYKQPESEESKPLPQQPDIWFDDVDECLIEGAQPLAALPADTDQDSNPLVKKYSFTGLTKAVAMDCEMVGVGEDGKDSVLARVSIVNQFGNVLLDKYVKPREQVTDYRTAVSGIRPHNIENAEEFTDVQAEVCAILKGRILVGHALQNDLAVLYLSHPRKETRDTSRYKPFRTLFNGRIPSLKKLSEKLLSVEVQTGEHSSVQDAQAAMRIYTMHRKEWEKSFKSQTKHFPFNKRKKSKPKSQTNK